MSKRMLESHNNKILNEKIHISEFEDKTQASSKRKAKQNNSTERKMEFQKERNNMKVKNNLC